MRILNDKRGSGKTTKAIECAYYTGSVLIVPNRQTAQWIQKRADAYLSEKFMAEPGTVRVASVDDLLNDRLKGFKFKGVVIDELDWILKEILTNHGLPNNIYLATRGDGDTVPQDNYYRHPFTEYGDGAQISTTRLAILGKTFYDKESLDWLADAVREKMEKDKKGHI